MHDCNVDYPGVGCGVWSYYGVLGGVYRNEVTSRWFYFEFIRPDMCQFYLQFLIFWSNADIFQGNHP